MLLNLRIGHQDDIKNSDRNVSSIGVGLKIFGLNISIGAAANDSLALALALALASMKLL